MRKFVKAAGLGVLVGLSLAAVAGDNNSADTRAYLNFNFGGDRALSRDWHAGLQLSSAVEQRPGEFVNAGTMKMDFSNRGNALMVNGVPMVSKSYRLQQAEGEAEAAVAEEGGFFSGIGDFFSNLFGGGEEEVAEEAAATEEAAAEEVDGEPGMFDGYSTGDWALLGVGVLGAGYLIAEAASSDDSDAPQGSTTGSPQGGTTGAPLGGVLGILLVDKNKGYGTSVEYKNWLDGGTGQMGDLIAQ